MAEVAVVIFANFLFRALQLAEEINGSVLRHHCLEFVKANVSSILQLESFPQSVFRQSILSHLAEFIAGRLQTATVAAATSKNGKK